MVKTKNSISTIKYAVLDKEKIINYIVDNHKPFVTSDEAEKAAVEALRDGC